MSKTRIVVGVDGSEPAESAVGWAAAEAVSTRASLQLVHAFVWPRFRVPPGPSAMATGLRAAAHQIADTALELAHKLEPDLTAESSVMDGFALPVLTEQSRAADLLVIGSREVSPLRSVLVGSTGVGLAAYSHCPVVIVPPQQLEEAGNYVVIGYDGLPPSVAAFRYGREYARRHGLVVRVVSVQQPGSEHEAVPADQLAALTHLVPDGPPVEISHVIGHPAEQLLRLSADAQLLLVGSHGHGGYADLRLGSVSQTVLHHAACPVCIVH
ncbi:universal stress protein [Streptomyces sp. SID13031]|uniref:universal stress protein n=1 Tax=Streptomyces sp. SID13031 TaxID=2706046 RepID=UPI0013C98631|nr:universal stress protein [Streptomyces sp. SID13031]NEA37601.1 universal stress protein [Streptomyces sp. SID13031]